MLALLLACTAQGDTLFPCDYTATAVASDDDVFGATATSILQQWEGTSHYKAVGVADGDSLPGADWLTGWTVSLKPSGDAYRREAWDCSAHLSVPVDWTITLDNKGLSKSGDGALVQEDSAFQHGEIRSFGPNPWDVRIELATTDAAAPGEALYRDFPNADHKKNAPQMSMSGTGDTGQVYFNYRTSDTQGSSVVLHGIREPM